MPLRLSRDPWPNWYGKQYRRLSLGHCHDLRGASGGLTPRLLGWLTPGVRPILMHRPGALHVPGTRGPSVHPWQSLRMPSVV
jgi:hypothetical protein